MFAWLLFATLVGPAVVEACSCESLYMIVPGVMFLTQAAVLVPAATLALVLGTRWQIAMLLVLAACGIAAHPVGLAVHRRLTDLTQRRGAVIVRALDAFRAAIGRDAATLDELPQFDPRAVARPLLIGSRWRYVPGHLRDDVEGGWIGRLSFEDQPGVHLGTDDGVQWSYAGLR